MARTHRSTTAGMMGAVLVASLGLAALQSGSLLWASLMHLLTCGLLAFGVVGAVCGRGPERAWWLGFAVFGWGYLGWAYFAPWDSPITRWPPTLNLLRTVAAKLGVPPARFEGWPGSDVFEKAGHCLWGLLFATLGGLLARLAFAAPAAGSGGAGDDRPGEGRVSRGVGVKGAAAGLAGLALFAAVALHGARTAPGVWAGVAVLLTWGLLGLAALGAALDRGERRARWLGAALFGAGYLLQFTHGFGEQNWPQLATNRLLIALRPWLPTVPTEAPVSSDAVAEGDNRALRALDRVVPMHFPGERTPLEDVLRHVAAATQGADGREVPIYVDPVGLQEAEKTLRSTVDIDLDGVPLRTSLHLALRQIGMVYRVKGGLIEITSASTGDGYDEQRAYEDPYLVIGQCVLALLAAGLGGLLAPLVRGRAVGSPPAVTAPSGTG